MHDAYFLTLLCTVLQVKAMTFTSSNIVCGISLMQQQHSVRTVAPCQAEHNLAATSNLKQERANT